jgi:hypothetical protein
VGNASFALRRELAAAEGADALYGACLPDVGLMDMLRFHKFSVGPYVVSEFGSPDNPEEFPALRAISPYHNLKKGVKYPATLVTTAAMLGRTPVFRSYVGRMKRPVQIRLKARRTVPAPAK